MAQSGLTLEQGREALAAWRAAGENATQAAAQLGMPRATFQNRLRFGKRMASMPADGAAKIAAVGAPLESVSAAWFKDNDVSVLCRFDNQGETTSFLDQCRESFDDISAAPRITLGNPIAPDLLTVYPIVDHHLAMHAWGRETGESYDLKKGVGRLLECSSRLIGATPKSGHAQIVNLGDFFHADDSRNETPASGHRLDVDGRYYKVINAGVDVTAAVIEMAAAKHETVTYRAIRGNHDPHSHVALTVALQQRYRDNPRITIEASENDFHPIRWGSCMALCHHGDKAKAERLVHFMADHYAKHWGETFWRYLWTGHIHHDSAKDIGGVHWESFRTLAPKDSYAHTNAYSSRQTMQAITLSKEHGEIERNKVQVLPPWAT